MNRKLVLNISIALIIILMQSKSIGNYDTRDWKLVVARSEIDKRTVIVSYIDSHGDFEDIASSATFLISQTYVSQSSHYLAIMDLSNGISVYNYDGSLVYGFSTKGFESRGWYFWGWYDDLSIVMSRIEDQSVRFYRISIDTGSAAPFVELNRFFAWNIDLLTETYNVHYPFLFVFSPHFDFVFTPDLPDSNNTTRKNDDVLLWRISAAENGPLMRFTSAPAWWYLLTKSQPTWSRNGSEFVIEDISSDVIAIVHVDPTSQRIVKPACSAEPCDDYGFSWNDTSSELVFWSTPLPYGQDRSAVLNLLRLADRETSMVYAAQDQPMSIVWVDQDTLAFAEDQENNSSSIKLLDIRDGTVSTLFNSAYQLQIIGKLVESVDKDLD